MKTKEDIQNEYVSSLKKLKMEHFKMEHFRQDRQSLAEKLFVGVEIDGETTWIGSPSEDFIDSCFRRADAFLKVARKWDEKD